MLLFSEELGLVYLLPNSLIAAPACLHLIYGGFELVGT
jgi:hypothetical protein